MISNSWNKIRGESISQKFLNKVKSEEPMKNKIDFAQKKLQFQIIKLDEIDEKLKKKHDIMFEKIVNAQRLHQNAHAQTYANELGQIRKMKSMIHGAKISMERIKLRLDTVSELGDVVVTLSPCMSIIKGLGSLGGIVPEANASMQDLSQILGEIMSGSAVTPNSIGNNDADISSDTQAILDEAHHIIAGEAKTAIPVIPDTIHKQSAQRGSDIII